MRARNYYGSQAEGELVRKTVRKIMPRNYRGQKYKSKQEMVMKNTAWGLSSCMYWTGSIHKAGYGVYGKKSKYAHRLTWELANGPIPDGLHALHKCDVPMCCNPDHIFLGTHQDNMIDMDKKGRRKAPKGEDQFKSKLTEEQVLKIRKLYVRGKSNFSIPKLAKMFGVTGAAVGYILQRKTWRHI